MQKATHRLTAVFGTLAGIAGMEHGVGEVLQGNVAPDGVMILSWPTSPFFRILGGEPAMTLVPSLLWSGVLSIAVSLLMIAWVLRYAERRHAGLVLIGLSVVLLLVGGGFGPPLLATIVGIAATRAGSTHRWVLRVPRFRGLLARAFPRVLVVSLCAWLGLLLGIPLLDYAAGIDSVALVLATIAAAFGMLALSIIAGYASDATLSTPVSA